MILGFELVAVAFLLMMIYLTYFSFKRNQIKKYGLVFWMFLWVSGIFAVVFNKYVNKILEPLNIARVFDLYTIAGFLIFLFIMFYLFKAIQRIENKMEIITREIAIKPIKEMKRKR